MPPMVLLAEEIGGERRVAEVAAVTRHDVSDPGVLNGVHVRLKAPRLPSALGYCFLASLSSPGNIA